MGDDRGPKKRERESERGKMRGNVEGRLGGKREKRSEAQKLASGHLMTNKGTALHHCRTPFRRKEEKHKVQAEKMRRIYCFCTTAGPVEARNIAHIVETYSHFCAQNTHKSEYSQQIFIAPCFTLLLPPSFVIYGNAFSL